MQARKHNHSFISSQKTKKIIISDSVKIIEQESFEYSNIHEIIFGKNVIGIGNNCFKDCHSLFSIEFGEKFFYLPDTAFLNCYSLTEVKYTGKRRMVCSDEVFEGTKVLSVEVYDDYERKMFCGIETTVVERPVDEDDDSITIEIIVSIVVGVVCILLIVIVVIVVGIVLFKRRNNSSYTRLK